MTSVARTFVCAAAKAPKQSRTLSSIRPQVFVSPLRQAARRGYSTPPPSPPKGGKGLITGLLLAAGVGGGYYLYSNDRLGALGISSAPKVFVPSKEDYQKVYNDVADLLEDNDYDDGSYGPVLLRLGWHASGTYDKETKTGGSNGATMRFSPESDHNANAGLKTARDRLETVKQKYPWISYSDLWILAAICAIQEMGGPKIPFRPGRGDKEMSACAPDGRLPDAGQEHDHLRNIFYRMGFNDQEIVALAGAHALGRCHTDRSGYDGPWTFAPTVLTNDYFTLLLSEKWTWKKWKGPKQLQDSTKSLMMLPADYALVKDKEFRKHVERYAKDQNIFFEEFGNVICKLFELGVPFPDNVEPITFKTTTE